MLDRPRRTRLATGVTIGLVAVALFEASLLRGETNVGGVLLTFFYPHWDRVGSALGAGQIPRWNPWADSGASWFGPRAGGVLYPGNLLFATFPLVPAAGLFLAGHLALAIDGARRWAGRGLPHQAALGAGLGYGLGGCVVSLVVNPIYLVSAAWLPWAALAGVQIPTHPVRAIAIGGTAIAFCFLVGEPQGALIATLAMSGMALSVKTEESDFVRRIVYLGATVTLGLAAGGLSVVSSLILLPETDRVLGGWEDQEFGLGLGVLVLDLLVPQVHGFAGEEFGAYWGGHLGAKTLWCGIGVGSFGLALLAAATEAPRENRRAKWEAATFILLGLILAILDVGALIQLRFPAKWFVLTALGLARAVGLGLSVVLKKPSPRARMILQISLGVGLIAGLGLFFVGPDEWFQAANPLRVEGQQARHFAVWALMRAACISALALVLVRPGRRHLPCLALGILTLDLFTTAKPLVRTTPVDVLGEPPLATLLTETDARGPRPFPRLDSRRYALPLAYQVPPGSDAETWNRFEIVEMTCRDLLWPNAGYHHGVRVLDAFETVLPLERELLLQSDGFARLAFPYQAALMDAEFLLMGDEELSELPPDQQVQLENLGRPSRHVKGIAVLRNMACPPWVYLAQEYQRVDELNEAVITITDPSRPLNRVVLGPGGIPDRPRVSTEPRGDIRLNNYWSERIEMTVRTDHPTWLVVRDKFSDDWVAFVDGSPTPIARADLMFRAVFLPTGVHSVEFIYKPTWWTHALSCTIAGWLFLIGLGTLSIVGKRRLAGVPTTR